MQKSRFVVSFTIFLSILGLVLVNTASATEPTGEEEVAVVAEASKPQKRVSPTRELVKRKNEWLNSDPLGQMLSKMNGQNGFYLGWGMDVIPVSMADPAWAKHRQMAYERAVMNAEAEYVKFQSMSKAARKVKELFLNAELTAPDFQNEDLQDPGKVRQLFNKLLAVAEGKLDKSLEEMGVDPKEFEAIPKAQRADKLRDSIMISSVAEAFGELSGYLPVQTFEGEVSNGKNAIGVLMAISPKMRQFAHDVNTRRGKINPIPGKENIPLSEQIVPAEETSILQDFGVRRLFDEEGYPCLVAFGQWSNSYDGSNDTLYAKYQEAAFKQARSQAEAALSFYLNGQTHWQDENQVGNSVNQYYLTHHDNFKEEKYESSLIDIINEQQKSRAEITISGVYPLYDWVVDHPQTGHEIVGVVLAWSPKSDQSARSLKEWKPSKPSNENSGKQDESAASGKVEVKSSRQMMDVSDF